MVKRVFSLVLCVLFVAVFASCQKEQPKQPQDVPQDVSST